ncbi:MAG: PAS domain-containing sensor histidine kinase [Gemmatimonas sp.]
MMDETMPRSSADEPHREVDAPPAAAAVTPSMRQPDDKGQHDKSGSHGALTPHLWHEQMRVAMERAAAAVAHASRLVLRHTDDQTHARAGSPISDRLALSDARFRALVSVAGHVQWSVDPSGRMLHRQAAWKSFTGQPTAEMHAADGFGWADALHPADRGETLRLFLDAIRREQPFEHQARMRHLRDGRVDWRDMLMRAAPVRAPDGSIAEWVGVNVDVTDFVRARSVAETAANEARRDAERARDVAESASHAAQTAKAAKGRVLAAASHDLRTPLNAIAGYAGLLANDVLGPLTDKQREALGRIGIAQEHLLAIVNDILDAAQVESGGIRLALERLTLGDVCSRLTTIAAPHAESKGVHLSCQVVPLDDAERAHVLADRERVLQILVNLVTNAVKFTDAGGEVTVGAFVSENRIMMQVRDSGCGIPRDQHSRIFEPFVQLGLVEGEPAMRDHGIGLGLATSRDLARRMGGTITVESEQGVGSTFTLILPAAD